MNDERLRQIRQNPLSEAIRFQHASTGALVLRLLMQGDAEPFGRYLEDLGEESRRRFGPHPHTMAEARKICGEIAESETLRFLVLREDSAEALGYYILHPGVRPSEINRYAGYGIPLCGQTDCTFAPSIADRHQSRGLGSVVMPLVLDLVRDLGFTRVLLGGGAQATNARAIGYYTKFGFRVVGSFETNTEAYGRLDNHDMMMILSEASEGGAHDGEAHG